MVPAASAPPCWAAAPRSAPSTPYPVHNAQGERELRASCRPIALCTPLWGSCAGSNPSSPPPQDLQCRAATTGATCANAVGDPNCAYCHLVSKVSARLLSSVPVKHGPHICPRCRAPPLLPHREGKPDCCLPCHAPAPNQTTCMQCKPGYQFDANFKVGHSSNGNGTGAEPFERAHDVAGRLLSHSSLLAATRLRAAPPCLPAAVPAHSLEYSCRVPCTEQQRSVCCMHFG